MHVIAGKAVAFQEALKDDFKVYQQQIVANAARLASGLKTSGFRLVSGGTDNHLILVDVWAKRSDRSRSRKSSGSGGNYDQ